MRDVSVIMPTYNCGHFIEEAIESILKQTVQDVEIIVVDDGSTDDTEAVLRPYVERGAVRYVRQRNQGPSAARNRGIELATGRYLAFLDSDDSFLPRSLERRIGFLDRHPEVSAVFSDLYIHRTAGVPATGAHYAEECGFPRCAAATITASSGDEIVFGDRFLAPFVEHRIGMWPGVLMVRAEAAIRYRGEFDPGEVPDYAYRLFKNRAVGFIAEPLFNYNAYRGSLTRFYIRGVPSYIKVLESLADDLSREGDRWRSVLPAINRLAGNYHFSLGWYCSTTGALGDARAHFRRSIRLHPRLLKSYAYLALCTLPGAPVTRLRRLKRWLRGGGGASRS
jgi:glycosyltransferase involved in cell wall biosynthesis